jgi:hypothetical protein
MKTGDVILIVFDRVKGNGERQIRESRMDAILLVDGHLELFEIVVVHALAEDADEEIVGELVLIGEACGGDGFEAGKHGLVSAVTSRDGGEGIVRKLVVIAEVSEGGGALGKIAQVGLILLFENGVLGGEAVRDGLGALGEEGGGKYKQQAEALRVAHRYCRVPEVKQRGEKKGSAYVEPGSETESFTQVWEDSTP